jgi:hypothetical protein
MKRILLCTALISGLAVTIPAGAQAASDVRVGTLTCNESGGWGYIVGGSHRLRCTFNGEGRSERYSGSIGKYGVNVGYQSSGTLVWAVFAPTSDVHRGALRGHYAGATAGAAVGVGLSGNALVGGFDRSIMLQPVSVEGTTGLNVAAGVGTLTLN